MHDLRLALRLILRRPLIAGATIAILAVGIGANTVIFRIVNATFLRPLPFANDEELVRIYVTPETGGARISPGTDVFLGVVEHATGFAGVVGQRFMDLTLTTAAGPDRVTGIGVTAGWARTLGLTPRRGRTFLPEEERAGLGAGVAVISDGAWRRRFGGDADILGRTVVVDGQPRTVVGVMPPGLAFPYDAEFWLPLDPTADGGLVWSYNIQARRAPGVTLEAVRGELRRLGAALPAVQAQPGMTLTAVPLRETLVGDRARLVTALLGAVAFLLLIVCANVAHLLLAESVARRREFALRAALGATWRRTTRQLLTEGAVLSVLGGALGLGLALLLGSVATVILPASLGQVFDGVPLDARVLGFTFAIAVAAGALAGVVPALWVSRRPPRAWLGGGAGTGVPALGRLAPPLIVSEIALAVVLLAGAGTLLGDLGRRSRMDLGYEADHLLTLNVSLTGDRYAEPAARLAFLRFALERLRAVPGVRAVSTTSTFPAEGQGTFLSRLEAAGVEGRVDAPVIAHRRLVSGGFVAAMGLRLLRGRPLGETDAADQAPVALVSRSLAERLWPGADPLGRQLRELRGRGTAPSRTVVGVVDDVREFYAETEMAWYLPLAQAANQIEAGQVVFVARGVANPAALARPLREAIWSVDPTLAVFDVLTARALYGQAIAARRSAGLLTALFAAAGLLVAALGVYASVAFAVGARRREIAVRMAVGAEPGRVVRVFVARSALLVGIGLVLGLGAAVALSDWLGSVTGAGRSSPAFGLAASVLLAVVTLLAGYLPARGAARSDPARELRGA